MPEELKGRLDPGTPIAYKLVPLSDVVKQDKRSSMRFSHQPGAGVMPVYPQVLFDLFVCKTDQQIETEGQTPPWIEDPKLIPPPLEEEEPELEHDSSTNQLIRWFRSHAAPPLKPQYERDPS